MKDYFTIKLSTLDMINCVLLNIIISVVTTLTVLKLK